MINILQNSLVYATRLVHLDLCGLPVMSIDFLILDDYKRIHTSEYCSFITFVKQLTKLNILSLNTTGNLSF